MSKEQTFLMKPKVDLCFKELMEDEEVCKGFISALLDIEPEYIRSTELLPPHRRKEHEEDKQGILDVRAFVRTQAKGKEGTFKEEIQEEVSRIDLEIQLASFPLWPECSIFYLAKMYVGGIQKGQRTGTESRNKNVQEYPYTREATCSRLIQEFSISSEEAESYLEKYWEIQP